MQNDPFNNSSPLISESSNPVATLSPPPMLQIDQLIKNYGRVKVLDHLNLSVNKGEVYGFLGRNGAGKSTTIRIIMGITKPTKGNIRIMGKTMGRSFTAIRQKIGYVAQEQHFYSWMTPKTLGEFVRGFYPTWDQFEYERLLNRLTLSQKQKIGTFSGGMVAKLALAVALAHNPELLVLDEPTAGLDPVARREFIDMVRDQAQRGHRTTFFSSHLIDEVEAVSSTVGIIEQGKLIYEGSLETLKKSVILLQCQRTEDESLEAASAIFEMVPNLLILKRFYQKGYYNIIIRAESHEQLDEIPAIRDQWKVAAISLEDIFISLVGKTI